MRSIVLLMIMMSFFSKPGEVATMNTVSEIEYRYGDSSVPPEYHRSYSISVNAVRVKIIVDSYGHELARREYPSSKEVLDRLRAALVAGGVQAGTEQENPGCTGGTTERVICRDGERLVLDVRVYHCGGAGYGTLRGDIAPFRSAVKSLVPDLAKLLQR